ncbi:MAG: sigma-70 family RNA polymerase sigma factor [bacterium]
MLNDSSPTFLNLLDANPEQALRQFYAFGECLFRVRRPRAMHGLSDAEADDLVREVLLHLVEDNFRVLRQYQNRGKPFAAWLYLIAHNKCLDLLRRRKRHSDLLQAVTDGATEAPGVAGSDPELTPEQDMTLKTAVTRVRQCLQKMGSYCRLLLELAADEYTPREVVRVLGWTPDKNKKVSDDLRTCRGQLKKLLGRQGLDLTTLLA